MYRKYPYRTERLEFPGQLNEEDLLPGLVIKRIDPAKPHNGFDVITLLSPPYVSTSGRKCIKAIWHLSTNCRCTEDDIRKVTDLVEWGEYQGEPQLCGGWVSATMLFVLGLEPRGGDSGRADEWYNCYLLPAD